jgi:hypothetical protein
MFDHRTTSEFDLVASVCRALIDTPLVWGCCMYCRECLVDGRDEVEHENDCPVNHAKFLLRGRESKVG